MLRLFDQIRHDNPRMGGRGMGSGMPPIPMGGAPVHPNFVGMPYLSRRTTKFSIVT